jgi:hypothetical protein
MELFQLPTQTWYLVICAGVALVLGFYALSVLLIALFPSQRQSFTRPGEHTYTSPTFREPVPGKPGLYSARQP